MKASENENLVEAVQYTGDNFIELCAIFGNDAELRETLTPMGDREIYIMIKDKTNIIIKVGDYIVRNYRGNIIACDKQCFMDNYERVIYGEGRIVIKHEQKEPSGKVETTFPAITTGKNFGEALEAVKKGKGMRLPSWKTDVVIRCCFPRKEIYNVTKDGESGCYTPPMTAPYLYVESRFGRVPWKETMIELFAENWEVVE